MIRFRSKIRRVLGPLCTAGLVASVSAQSASDSLAFQQYLDSLGVSRESLEAKARSTLMFGGSAPVSFSGEARLKLQYHQFSDSSASYVKDDNSWMQANWEGNESFIRLGMVARAGRNAVLWSKIGFQNTLPGGMKRSGSHYENLVPGLHDKVGNPAVIQEDMCAGMYLRTVPASFLLRLGSIIWTEASPFTIWKAQARMFAWEYLPFEVEQPISRYFEYNLAKGERAGRAAWNKKAFQGINLESVNLPGNLYFNFLYGTSERIDAFERDAIDFASDLALADISNEAKTSGINNTYQHVLHTRIAANELIGRITPGLNYVGVNISNDLLKNSQFLKTFHMSNAMQGVPGDSIAFYREPKVFSLDLRGPANDKLSIHGDIAIGVVESTLVQYDGTFNQRNRRYTVDLTRSLDTIYKYREWKSVSKPRLAAYLRLESQYGLPIRADLAYVQEGFYSPYSFANKSDLFYPIGANLVGPGAFAGGEASPYTQNLAGLNLVVSPKMSGYGHMRFTYGNHFQLGESTDALYFPYRLNGQDLFTLFHSSYNRWGNDLLDVSLTKKYQKRLGDESYYRGGSNVLGPQAGGLRSAFLSMSESFVPYENQADADSNSNEDYRTNLRNPCTFVPKHQKFSFNAEFDVSYDFGPMLGYSREIFLGAYGALNGVSKSFMPLTFSDKSENTMLFGSYLRIEPAIALSSKFYLLGMLGWENWKSQKAYMKFDRSMEADLVKYTDYDHVFTDEQGNATNRLDAVLNVPIDYRDFAVGIGFDWDMLSRVGLHGRVKWMKHKDVNWAPNSWSTPVVSTEIKMWF